MQDIAYHDAPDNWEWCGGEGDNSQSPEGYYVDWFISEKFGLEGTVDSPMGQNRHVIQVRKMQENYNQYVDDVTVGTNTIYHYLQGKQKAWDKAIKIMKQINEGEMLQDVVS